MKILWIATKVPWPPVDGGRLLLLNTLRALAAAGEEVTLVAPTVGLAGGAGRAAEELAGCCRLVAVPARLRPRAVDALRAQLRRRPWTIARHTLPAVGRRVRELLRSERFELVQAEQVQALGSLAGADTGAAPVVWRAQNVESDLWAAAARSAGWRRPLFELEARRLARWEGAAVRGSAATVALTREDADRLAVLAGPGEKVRRVAAPFEAELAAAERPLPGAPAVVLFGSGGWPPNRRGTAWFLEEIWPRVRAALSGAELHLFGPSPGGRRPGPGITLHPPPAASRAAYPPGSVMVVPLEIASGVRMKILEAWARGVPVVATPAAVRGLGAEPGRELAVAASAGGFVAALRRLHERPELRARRVAAARSRLRSEHAPDLVAGRLRALYAELVTSATATSSSAPSTSATSSAPSTPSTPAPAPTSESST